MATRISKPIPSRVLERMQNIHKSFVKSTSCWEWPKSKNVQTGYGQVSHYENGKHVMFTAHRVSLVLVKGEPSDSSLCALHSCDNRGCINPDHLSWDTQKENIKDMFTKNRQKVYDGSLMTGDKHWTSEQGTDTLPKGEACHLSVLKDDDIRHIRSSNEKPRVLAQKFGVTYQNIWAILKNKTWKHIS